MICELNENNIFQSQRINMELEKGKRSLSQEEKKNYYMEQLNLELNKLNMFCPVNKSRKIWKNPDAFPLLHKLYISLRSVYLTTVKCESTFSLLNYVKCDQRSCLDDKSVDSILRIKYTEQQKINEAISNIVKRKKEQFLYK